MKAFLIFLFSLVSIFASAQLQPLNFPGDTQRELFTKSRNNFNYLETRTDSIVANLGTGSGGETYNGDPTIILQDATHRFVTDLQITDWNSKADGDHNHDGVYQPLGNYALSTHNHDAFYSAITHNHDAVYQPLGSYAPLSHTHDLTGDHGDISASGVDGTTWTIDANAITTTKINNSAVTGAKIAPLAIQDSDVNDVSWSKITGAPSFSLSTHDHAGVYQPAGDYSLSTHNHDGVYQPVGNYSLSGHTHIKSEVGLSNVDNTSDANKPVSTAQQTALNAKQDVLVSGTNIKTINGTSVLGSGDIAISGGASNETFLILAADVASPATTALTNLTGMTFDYEANKHYVIEFFMVMNSPQSTTGFGFGVNCSTAPVLVSFQGTTNSSSAGAASAWSARANNEITVAVSGTVANAQNIGSHGSGIVVTGASAGTMQFIFRSETTVTTTAKANSVIRITKIN